MLLGALLIGLLTAYYLGLEVGITAAIAAAGLFLAAAVIPVLSVPIYLVVAVFIIGVIWLGPRRARAKDARVQAVRTALRRWSRQILGKVWRRM